MKTINLTIWVTPLKGEEIRIEKVCTLKQAVALAKKEARKMINSGGLWVTINIQTKVTHNFSKGIKTETVETLAHIEAEKEERRVAFSDEAPAETETETETTNPDNTPSTMNASETVAPEFSELSHAGQCLDIYLHNNSFIYEYYTQKAIDAIVNNGLSIGSADIQKYVRNALNRAMWEVEKYDHLTPTAQDIDQVTRNYAAYIVECAKYEMKNA